MSNYYEQAEAAERIRRRRWKDATFGEHYGGRLVRQAPFQDTIVLEPYAEADVRFTADAARRMMWAFSHPFSRDLMACAETNS